MSLERLIVMLEAIAEAGRPMSAAEIQRATGLPRPTCYRLIQSLASQRLIDAGEEDGRWVLGDRFYRIAMIGRSNADIRLATSPLIKDAAINDGETFFLSHLARNRVEIIHVETPKDPSVSYIHPGLGPRPMHACSCAKAIAAFSDAALQRRVIEGKLKSYTDRTKVSADDVEAEFEKIREHGFAECVEEIEVGIASVAAPVLMSETTVPFAVGTIGPIRRFTEQRRAELGETLLDIAAHVRTKVETSFGPGV